MTRSHKYHLISTGNATYFANKKEVGEDQWIDIKC